MKKSLVILSIALAISGYESQAHNGLQENNKATSQHSSSLTNLEQYTQLIFHTKVEPSTAINRGGRRSISSISGKHAPLMLHGNSPSSRKNNHWLIDEQDEDLMPVAPDEIDDLAEIAAVETTIEKIKRIDRKKAVTAEAKSVKKLWYQRVREDAHIEIYVSGGGFRGGIDPVVHDQIMISNSGLIQKHYESEVKGITAYKKQVNREELYQLVQWIAESGFFEMNREYSCAEEDENCLQRMEMRPTPIPLKVVVALGPYRNVISIPMYAPEKSDDFIDYPDNLRLIVKAIYDFASL